MYFWSEEGPRLPNLAPLLQLQVIDQSGFPLVTGFGGISSLFETNAFSEHGDYTDLVWIKQALQKSYAINWREVKECWKNNFLTDPDAFRNLLAMCPDPRGCIAAVNKMNLTIMLQTSSNIDLALDLAWKIFENINSADESDSTAKIADQYDPLFQVSWFLFTRNPSKSDEKSLRQFNPAHHLTADLRLSFLRWAAKHSTLEAVDKDECRTHLYDLLKTCTSELLTGVHLRSADEITDAVVEVWSNNFAPLTRDLLAKEVGPDDENSKQAELIATEVGDTIDRRFFYWLAASQYPPNRGWPRLVQLLSTTMVRLKS